MATVLISQNDHPFITSQKGLGGWVQKMAVFADVLYYIYADIVGESERVPKCADVMYGWFNRKETKIGVFLPL